MAASLGFCGDAGGQGTVTVPRAAALFAGPQHVQLQTHAQSVEGRAEARPSFK
jgi:hypothetical protein